jgi:orotidine-5'-phosphate decarboxylase
LAPGDLGPIGAVIGPVHFEPSLDLSAVHAIFLAPGVGAQGATASDVAAVFCDCPDRVIPSASRSLLAEGPNVARLRETAGSMAEEFRSLLRPP